MDAEGVVALLSIFVALPTIVFGFIYLGKRERNRMAELACRKEIAELELQKAQAQLRLLEAESRKMDRAIEGGGSGR